MDGAFLWVWEGFWGNYVGVEGVFGVKTVERVEYRVKRLGMVL